MLSRLSIRARITVGSVLVAAVLLAVALLIVQAQFAATLADADATLARNDLSSFVVDIQNNPNEPVDDPGTGVLVVVRDPTGTVQLNTLPHDVDELVRALGPSNTETTLTDDEGRTFVVACRLIGTADGDWSLCAARSTASSELALEGVDRVLLIGGLLLLIGFGLASWLLASAALRPVTAMRRKAEALRLNDTGLNDTDTSLPVGRANDELSALATTLNEFLGRLRSSADREKQMVSDAAHELRTPLAALKTQLELAHADFGDAEALRVQVTAAEASVARLSALASNLLELSRLEASRVTATVAAATLIDEFTGSVDRARLMALAHHTDISFDVKVPDETVQYPLDAHSFGRLVDNLLSNAVAAVDDGGAVVAMIEQLPDSLELTVSDNGPGMPEDFLAVAFDRFTRPDESRTTATGGSGLGLALVQAIAVGAGGTVSVDNTHPGLRVTARIPKM